ncbi:hypothetical protein QYE76_025435 [Lolium multiflorum]|uniref:Uncharacterized protein n=1 Tax=Lolium multiflorum TaxID=4521 RepID=A0AAD8RIJ8_LOLMU|nr:hypothetical protein QYE76_025435 [Lolium multiflorum]
MMAASVDVVTLSRRHLCPSWHYTRRVGDARLPVKTVLRPRLADDGDVSRRYLLEGIVVAVCGLSLVLLRGNPRSGLPDRTMAARPAPFYLLGHRFLDAWAVLGGVVFIYHIVGAVSQRHGAAGYQRQMRDDV